MKLTLKILTSLILTRGLISCDRIQRRAKQTTERVKDTSKGVIKRQKDRVVHKIFPPFDHEKPGTESNKKLFKDFLKVEITPDVKDIYCFDDAIGIDADYMFSFRCDSATSNRIIKVNELKIDLINTDNGFYMPHDFRWRNREGIAKLQKYTWTNGDRYFKYYWYDEEVEKAYFFDFDM